MHTVSICWLNALMLTEKIQCFCPHFFLSSLFNLHLQMNSICLEHLQHKLPHGLSCATLIMFPQKFIGINFSLQPLCETVGSTSYLSAKNQRKKRLGLNLSEMSSNFGSPWMTSRADNLQYSEIYRPSYVHFTSKSALTVILNISDWYKSSYGTLKVIWKSQVKLMNIQY